MLQFVLHNLMCFGLKVGLAMVGSLQEEY